MHILNALQKILGNSALSQVFEMPHLSRKPHRNQTSRPRLPQTASQSQNNPRSKRKPGQRVRQVRIPQTQELKRCTCILQLTMPVIMRPFAQVHPAKIKSQHHAARPPQPPRHPIHDLVMHSPAVQRMRMANQTRLARCRILRLLEQSLQPSRRPVDEKGFNTSRQVRGSVS